MKSSYYVKALWDPEASVWISETDVPGLVIEANTLSEFESLVMELAPEMLEANKEQHAQNVPLVFTARRELAIA
jgi:Domain of unknown function (DUF1902)